MLALSLKELRKTIQKIIILEDLIPGTNILQNFLKNEAYRYLDYYAAQFFRGYSEEDVQRLKATVAAKLGNQATEQEIEDRVRNHFEKNKYDLPTIKKKVSQFIKDSVKQSKDEDFLSYLQKAKFSSSDLSSIIDDYTNVLVGQYINEKGIKI